MDNLSHTLAGLVAAEAAAERSGAEASRRTLLFVASVVANNFPDLDILYGDLAPAPLGYLLHHRGHTHTLGGVLLQVAVIVNLLFLIPSFRRHLKDLATLKLTIGVVATGLMLHLMMDGWNSYGVHPLWPISSKWYYGDAVFIIEPFVWISLTVPLLFLLISRAARGILLAVVTVIPVVAWSQGFLSGVSLVFLLAFALPLAGLARSARTKTRRLFLAVASAVLFVMTQLAASSAVRFRVVDGFRGETATHRLLDVVTNPSPANPLCWNTLRVEADPARDLLRGVAALEALVPESWIPWVCPARRTEDFRRETTLSRIGKAVADDCRFAAWLRFARVPMLEGDAAFDLRFATGLRENFTELPGAGTPRACPPYLPNWDHPRQDVIEIIKLQSH